MDNARLLIVEDDIDIANMLKIFFSSQGYQIDLAMRGSEALDKAREMMPHLIVLDIMLPDIDGYEVCKQLRTKTRTSHIPIIFLTQKDERSDRLAGLELGVDDYITKPFDIEELKLRVHNAITRSERESLTDANSGLPSGRAIEDQLRKMIRLDGWALMDIRIDAFEPFKEVYGFITATDVIRYTALLLGEIMDELGDDEDFLGHVGGDNFVVITKENNVDTIREKLKSQFTEKIQLQYNFMDRQQGYITVPGESGEAVKAPLMTLTIGVVSPSTHDFSDIREITELAAEERRRDTTAI
jgi:DNA-binding response OmpR family regulator